ncbi:MAG: hypothetical protein Q9213_006745 [Squamulea squamosa]
MRHWQSILTGLTIQATDSINNCGPDTLAYLKFPQDAKPHITLCPPVFKKKAFTMIKAAKDPENNPDHYVRCQELQANGHMSYLMETMGATLLHEYMQYNKLVESVYGTMIDDQKDGYGTVDVYNKLEKATKSRLNADSYLYYVLERFWTEYCQTRWLPPR